MREMINLIISTWKSYWGSSGYPYLLAIALLYLVICERKKRSSMQLAVYTVLALGVFWFPPTAWILQKCVGAEVYWRVLWTVPTVPVIAYAGTSVIKKLPRRIMRAAALVCALVIIAVSGKEMLKGNYARVHNYQQVPDEVAHVCNLVNAHRGDGEALLVTDDNLSPYIRVYDPSIKMPYGRLGRGFQANIDRSIYWNVNVGREDYAKIGLRSRERGCNYIVICIYSEEQQQALEAEGYELLEFVNQYGVFALREA